MVLQRALLGWEQSNLSTGRERSAGMTTVTHRRMRIPSSSSTRGFVSVSRSGLALLVPGADLNSASTLTTLNGRWACESPVGGRPHERQRCGYSGGFIMGPDIKSGTRLWRVSLGGAVTKLQALPKPAANGLCTR